MEKYLKKIFMVGDEVPQINIICDILHEGLRLEYRDFHNRDRRNVILCHCDSYSYIEYDDVTHIYSSFIPYGSTIFMRFTDEKVNVNEFDEVVYMEPYPFTLGEKISVELDDINNYLRLNSRIQFKIMFYRNISQKSGEGDIVGIEQALQEAPNYIKSKVPDESIIEAIEFCIYRTPRDLIKIVYGSLCNVSIVAVACKERFRQYKNRIDHEFFFSDYGAYKDVLEFKNYEKYASLLQAESLNRITKFQKVKGSNDIVKTYVNNYKTEFQDLLLELIEEVYIEVIRDICFWDLEKDIDNLKKDARKFIENSLMSVSGVKQKCPQFESDYNETIRNNLKLDTLFEEKAILLVNNEIMEYLYNYLMRKEKLLSKIFDNRN